MYSYIFREIYKLSRNVYLALTIYVYIFNLDFCNYYLLRIREISTFTVVIYTAILIHGRAQHLLYSVTCNEKPYQESIAASVAVSETENSSDKIRKFQSTKKREIYSCEKQSYKLNQIKNYLLVAIQNEINSCFICQLISSCE